MSVSLRALSLFLLTAMFAWLCATPAVHAQDAAVQEGASPTPAPSVSAIIPSKIKAVLPSVTGEPESYTVFLRSATVENGLISLIRKNDQLYFDLAPEDFHKTFLIAPSLASGLGAGTYAGRLYEPMLVQFKRVGDRVLWITPNTEFSSSRATEASLKISTAP